MSYVNKMNFVSPEPLYEEIKETLRSYFESGAVDDLMFERWTDNCLRKFYNSTYKIEQAALEIRNFQAQLPDNFQALREAWACTNVVHSAQAPNAFYYSKDCRVTNIDDPCHECAEQNLVALPCSPCDKKYIVTHKITNEIIYQFNLSFLLTPGNINAKRHCGNNCANLHASTPYSFDINDCKFLTNFEHGLVYIDYYTNSLMDDGTRLIPDNIRVFEYIKTYIIYKIFEFLYHQATDESLKQIENKLLYYKQLQEEAYIIADIELKKETVYDIARQIKKVKDRYRGFNIR